jgi:CBS domain-containing protein
MLRHLGAAYYDSLHGRAAPADVTRAVNSVAEHMGEQPEGAPAATTDQPHGRRQHHGRFHSRVRDVMTTDVVTVDRITPYKDIVRRLAEHQISGMPVLTLGRHVAGIVSEADLVAAQDRRASAGRGRLLHRTRGDRQHTGLTAEQLMTSPAVTTRPDATIATAARLMTTSRARRLPVVDQNGKLIGIVSRRDLLSLFMRTDDEIAGQITELLTEVLPGDPACIAVHVHDGVVTLVRKTDDLPDGDDQLPVAVRLCRDIGGVIDVIDKTTMPARACRRRPAALGGAHVGAVQGHPHRGAMRRRMRPQLDPRAAIVAVRRASAR